MGRSIDDVIPGATPRQQCHSGSSPVA